VKISDNVRIRFNEPMSRHTSFRIGGPADMFAEPVSPEELRSLILYARDRGLPVTFIGDGSNLLVRDSGIRGVTVRLAGPFFTRCEIDGNRVLAAQYLDRPAFANGFEGADFHCQRLAANAGLDGTWQALLGLEDLGPKERLAITGAVQNTNGDVVANDAYDFWDGALLAGIAFDENGDEVPGTTIRVWTGSSATGGHGTTDCNDWSGEAGSGDYGVVNLALSHGWMGMTSPDACSAASAPTSSKFGELAATSDGHESAGSCTR